MIRYALRVAPWTLLGVGCAVIGGLLALVAAQPYTLWPLQGTAVGVMSGLTAWTLDEPSATIVDTLPRPLWWRSLGRCAVVVPAVMAVWVIGLTLMRSRIPDHLGLFVVQGFGAITVSVSVTTSRRSSGITEPGAPFAAAAIPTVTAFALARPFTRWLPAFPVWPYDHWTRSWMLWCCATVLSPATALVVYQYRYGRTCFCQLPLAWWRARRVAWRVSSRSDRCG